MTTLTLKGRGRELVLFAPQALEDGSLSASAVMVTAPCPKPLVFRDGSNKFRAPAIPRRGFFIADIVLKKVN